MVMEKMMRVMKMMVAIVVREMVMMLKKIVVMVMMVKGAVSRVAMELTCDVGRE